MYYFLVFILSLLPIINIFLTSDLHHTHDGFVHLARMGAYFKALIDGQFPVRWAGDLNYGYGMPLFNFIYPLPYFFSSIFLFLGFNLVTTFKIVLSISYILSGIFMFAFAREFFKDAKKALLVAVLYQFAQFRLIELVIRGSFGEVYAYAFLPLVLFALVLLFEKQTYFRFILPAIAAFLLIMSHNSLSLVFFGIAALFVLFFAQTKRNLLIGFSSLILGLLLSGFYWIPAMYEHKYTYGDLFMKDMYLTHFPPLSYFFVPNPTNSERFLIGGIAIQIGTFHVIAVLMSVFFLFKKKVKDKEKRLLFFSLFLTFSALFFMQPASKLFWENISYLRQFQFPWRFLAVLCFSTSLLSISFFHLNLLKKPLFYWGIIFLIVFSTVYYWRPVLGVDKINEAYYWNFPLSTTYFGETDVIWSVGPAKAYPKQRVEVIGGQASLANFTKRSNIHTFTIVAKTDTQLVDHTQYFPGWRVFVDNKPVSIEFQDQNWRGEITFVVPKGTHNVKVAFGESPIRFFANSTSLLSLTILLFVWIFRRTKK